MDYVSVSESLLSGLVSALFILYLSNRNEKTKHKRLVKANLIKSLHLFFSYWKMRTKQSNHIGLKMREGNDLHDQVHTNVVDEGLRNKMLSKFNMEEKDLFRKTDSHYNVSEKQMEVESEIESLIVQIYEYYGKSKFEKIETVLRPIITRSHMNKKLYSYETLSSSELKAAKIKLPEQLKTVNETLDRDKQILVTALNKIL